MQLEFWIDANLPHKLANWINQAYGCNAYSLHFLELLKFTDESIFELARKSKNVILITKDQGFCLFNWAFGAYSKGDLDHYWQLY